MSDPRRPEYEDERYERVTEARGPAGPPPWWQENWWIWLLLLVAGVLVALGILFFAGDDDDEPARSTVPSVIGLQEDEAVGVLRDAGYEVAVRREVSDEPENRVLDQDPEAGTRLPRGRTVEIVTSAGQGATVTETVTETETQTDTETVEAEPAEMPDVIGLDHTDAGAAVSDAGLVPQTYPVPSSDERGLVIAQRPAPGTQVDAGSKVRLNVSLGEGEREAAEVPDVTGPELAEALERCREAGFTCRVVDRSAPSDEEVGEVIDQAPAAGSTAPVLTQMTLYVGR